MAKTRWLARFFYLGLALSGFSCGDDKVVEIRTCNPRYPAAPGGAKQIVHVAKCSVDNPDGSPQRPFPGILPGLLALDPGGTLLIGPGVYEESVSIGKPASILGATEEDEPGASVTVKPPAGLGVNAQPGEGASLVLSGLRIEGASGVGVDLQNGNVKLLNVSVVGTRKQKFKDEVTQKEVEVGLGVLVRGGTLDADGLRVEDTADTGLVMQAGSGSVRRSRFSRNGLGGVRVDRLSDTFLLEDCELQGNTQLGIGILAGPVILTRNKILDTRFHAPSSVGDGILVTAPLGKTTGVPVTLEENTVINSARVGLLLGQGSLGHASKNEISESARGVGFGAGIWLQTGAGGDAGFALSGNKISQNRFVGIAVTSGSRATIADNTIEDTSTGMVALDDGGSDLIGDGVGLFDLSTVTMSNNSVARNGRCGLITDNVSGSGITVQGNTFSENTQEGVVIQNPSGPPVNASSNTFLNNPSQGPKVIGDPKEYLPVRKSDFKAQ
jgi:parallel beta-helix repeat protein